MKRRGFIAILGAAAALPLAGHAQQPDRVRRVGVLIAFPQNNPDSQAIVKAFAGALGRLGWVEGKNIRIDYRFAAGNPALFKAYAAALVRPAPDAILASTAPALMALRAQTRTIPIVFVVVPDPVGLGVVQSLAHPGGNITGFASYNTPIIEKWLQLLKQIAPDVTRVAIMFNPDTAFAPPLGRVIDFAPSLGVAATLALVHDGAGIEKAIAAESREPGGGLICLPDSFNVAHRDAIIAAVTRHRIPLVGLPEFVRAGGLLSYWYDIAELHAEAASYIDRILKGANPADLPVQYPTKYSLIINLKTAKALGLTVSPSILAEADEVIG
jgi:putative tryptophan/tyrosine transport system substrate-binding protein